MTDDYIMNITSVPPEERVEFYSRARESLEVSFIVSHIDKLLGVYYE